MTLPSIIRRDLLRARIQSSVEVTAVGKTRVMPCDAKSNQPAQLAILFHCDPGTCRRVIAAPEMVCSGVR